MFNMKQITALAVSTFCLVAVQGTASAAIIQVNENLNNNLVPSGFSLTTTNSASLVNGRLEASAINGSAALHYTALPSNLSQVDISYRGHFGSSFWGTYTQVELTGLTTLFHGVAEFNYGSNNHAIAGGDTSTSPINLSEFEYAITVIDGQISFSGTDTATNIEEFSLTYADAGILLTNLTQIGFRSHNTTGSEPVWLDDISMQLHTMEVPAPGILALFGLGILGLGLAHRRRIA
ncbi:MAG: hypothetical protein ACI9JL_000200 [Paracoccaceae bacterium]|jgi:hypothetical protein